MANLNNVDLELLKTLAAMEGEEVEIRDGRIIMKDESCPTYGGTHYAATQEGLEEAIEAYTYFNLHPLK